MAKVWNWIKLYLFKFLGSLIMDNRDGVQVLSLGRVLLLTVFATMLVCWHKETPTLPGGLMEAFYALLGYVFGTKAVQTTQSWLELRKAPEAPEQPPVKPS